MQRVCVCCGEAKPLEEYRFNTKSGRYSHRCVDCGGTKNSTNHYSHTSAKALLKRRLTHARTNQRRFSCLIDFDFLWEMYEKQGGLCAVSKQAMTHSYETSYSNISIDRIDCNRGYEPDNVRLVCSAVNIMRNRMSDTELLFWSKSVVEGMSRAD